MTAEVWATWDDPGVTWDDTLTPWDAGPGLPGGHSVQVIIDGYDVTEYVRSNPGVTVRKGRQNPEETPQANSASLTIGPLPIAPDGSWLPAVGMSLIVNLRTPGGANVHFTGKVSDLTATLVRNSQGEEIGAISVIAVSSGLGVMAKAKIGDEPWPAELDGARIGRIIALAGVPVGTVDPGQITVNARDVDAQYCLELASRTSAEVWGMLVDGRDGSVGYQDNAHRNPETATQYPLYASQTLTAPKVGQHVGTVINRVRMTYGVDPGEGGGDRPTLIVEDTESIAARGLYEVSISVEIPDSVDADRIATLMLALYSVPRWATERLSIPLHTLGDGDIALIGSLEPSAYLALIGWPKPAPDPWSVWVEGVEDRFTYDEWVRDFMVSDRYAVSTGNPPPVPPVDCGDFDWDAICATENIIPVGLPVDNDSYVPPSDPETYAGYWDLDPEDPDGETYRLVLPPGQYLNAMGVVLGSYFYLGDTPGTHLDPWASGDPDADHCRGYWVGEPFGDPGVIEHEDTSGAWVAGPSDMGLLASLGWEPAVGWPEGAYTFSDGSVNIGPNYWAQTPEPVQECTSITQQALEAAAGDPTLSRISTIDTGRWLGNSTLFPVNPETGDFALMHDVRWSGEFGMKYRFRYARADLAG